MISTKITIRVRGVELLRSFECLRCGDGGASLQTTKHTTYMVKHNGFMTTRWHQSPQSVIYTIGNYSNPRRMAQYSNIRLLAHMRYWMTVLWRWGCVTPDNKTHNIHDTTQLVYHHTFTAFIIICDMYIYDLWRLSACMWYSSSVCEFVRYAYDLLWLLTCIWYLSSVYDLWYGSTRAYICGFRFGICEMPVYCDCQRIYDTCLQCAKLRDTHTIYGDCQRVCDTCLQCANLRPGSYVWGFRHQILHTLESGTIIIPPVGRKGVSKDNQTARTDLVTTVKRWVNAQVHNRKISLLIHILWCKSTVSGELKCFTFEITWKYVEWCFER